MRSFPPFDIFIGKAGEEVLNMYKQQLPHGDDVHIFRDRTASAAPVEAFYNGAYHTLVVAPATSNSVAKFVAGISDTLVTNVFAQAGKCRIPIFVFACDTVPELESRAPDGSMVKVYPRRIDLENVERLKSIENTTVPGSFEALQTALNERVSCLNASSF
jgi:flavoprotein